MALPDLPRRGFARLCLGFFLGAAGALVRADRGLRPPGPAVVWVADRDADEVLALDRDLLHVGRCRLRAPTLVRACSEGGAWVAYGGLGRDLARVDVALDVRHESSVEGRVLDAAVLDGGLVALIERGGGAALLRIDAQGQTIDHVPLAGATRLSRALDGSVCVHQDDGTLRCFSVGPPLVLRRLRLGAGAPMRGPEAVAPEPPFAGCVGARRMGGDWLFAFPGALVRTDPDGRPIRTQGGFGGIADLSVRSGLAL